MKVLKRGKMNHNAFQKKLKRECQNSVDISLQTNGLEGDQNNYDKEEVKEETQFKHGACGIKISKVGKQCNCK
jgi:hypothetical protein